MKPVHVAMNKITIPTYTPAQYETLPMFAENRVHQRSSGNPYPNPIVNQIKQDQLEDKKYDVIILENDYLYLEILPEIGGRIFTARDKTNGYDFFYRQHVIKPALIGMLGLWISGGIEFNWPVHHRPSTFLPVDTSIEHNPDGSVTVWMSEHEPLDRMKGMVGIHLAPDAAIFETKIRLFNRTNLHRSFLWWENTAVPVNEQYRIFFPPDVTYVQFHYQKATGGYPIMDEYFNTQDNRGGVDIRFHKNTRQATSYFCGPSRFDFFGGYDEGKQAGVVHYASHHTAVGRKLFTWGYRRLEKTWEHALTDQDGPYAELMAGSFSNNQPDFAWLEPFEVKEFSQSWFPIKEIGEVKQANEQMAISVEKDRIGIHPVRSHRNVDILVFKGNSLQFTAKTTLEVSQPVFVTIPGLEGYSRIEFHSNGVELLRYECPQAPQEHTVPPPIQDYRKPHELTSAQQCFISGMHVAQYRDPIIESELFWKRGLELDPSHIGCRLGLGWYYLSKLRFSEAEQILRPAHATETALNSHPSSPWISYYLGLSLKEQGKLQEADDLLHSVLWIRGGISIASTILAQIACIRGSFTEALRLLREGQKYGGYNQKCKQLEISVLRLLGKQGQAKELAQSLLKEDVLDFYARNEAELLGIQIPQAIQKSDAIQTALDIATDYLDAGMKEEAAKILCAPGFSNPMQVYLHAYITANTEEYDAAETIPETYVFPSRKWELQALHQAIKTRSDNKNEKAYLFLGDILYGTTRNHSAALEAWELAGESIQALRNRAVGRFSQDHMDMTVQELMRQAIEKSPKHLQLWYEYLRLMELQGIMPEDRIKVWEQLGIAATTRDDIFLLGVHAYNQAGRFETAKELLISHRFIPCEGGEHAVANEYFLANLGMACHAMMKQDWETAIARLAENNDIPECLGGGIWHEVMKTPYLYLSGICQEQMQCGSGRQFFIEVDSFPINYFTIMYLPSFPIWKALSRRAMGMSTETDLQDIHAQYDSRIQQPLEGFFSATPFFESFIEDPGQSQRQHYGLLLALCHAASHETKQAIGYCNTVLAECPFNIRAKLLKDFIRSNANMAIL